MSASETVGTMPVPALPRLHAMGGPTYPPKIRSQQVSTALDSTGRKGIKSTRQNVAPSGVKKQLNRIDEYERRLTAEGVRNRRGRVEILLKKSTPKGRTKAISPRKKDSFFLPLLKRLGKRVKAVNVRPGSHKRALATGEKERQLAVQANSRVFRNLRISKINSVTYSTRGTAVT
jgi:hypothetical protein